MQKIKLTAAITLLLFTFTPAIAQGPPVPAAPKKLQEIQQIRTPKQPETVQQNNVHTTPLENNTKDSSAAVPSQNKQITNETSQNTQKIKTEKEITKKEPSQGKFKNTVKNIQNKAKRTDKQNKKYQPPKTEPENKTKNRQEESAETLKNNDLPADTQNEETKPAPPQDTVKPSQVNDIREQAKFLYNSNKLDEAQQLFNKIPDGEKISDDWLFLANIAQDREKLLDAVFLLKKAIAADDNNYKAHYNLGNLYYYDNKINMAISEYKKVLKIKKDFAYAYYNKGCCYLKKESWFNARYEFGLAIKANPNEPAFYYNLAYTYKMMKKDKKAQEALEMYNKLMTQ